MKLAAIETAGPVRDGRSWQARYGDRHGYVRLLDDPALPNGRRGRVTIYQRGRRPAPGRPQTLILSWCWGGERHKERVIGDKFDAVRRADEICASMKAGLPAGKNTPLSVGDLVSRYLEHLQRRSDAGEISPRTPHRYRSALAHLTAFLQGNSSRRLQAWIPTGELMLRFKAYLLARMISPNGHPHSARRLLSAKGIQFALASVRAMVRWAAQEGLLAANAADVFKHIGRSRISRQAMSSVPITTQEAAQLIQAANLYQLAVFSFHIFHGARAAEPCWLMIEFVDLAGGWVDYRCIDELGYRTKGNVNKRLPMPAPMVQAVCRWIGNRSGGPLLLKRRLVEGQSRFANAGLDLARIIQMVQDRGPGGWAGRGRLAEACLKQLGAIDGDDIRREFAALVRSAGLRPGVTPKALRHHFATALEQAGVSYYTRKYLLGHRLDDRGRRGGDVTAIYTHLEPEYIKSMYQRVLDGPLAPVLGAFAARLAELRDEVANITRTVGNASRMGSGTVSAPQSPAGYNRPRASCSTSPRTSAIRCNSL